MIMKPRAAGESYMDCAGRALLVPINRTRRTECRTTRECGQLYPVQTPGVSLRHTYTCCATVLFNPIIQRCQPLNPHLEPVATLNGTNAGRRAGKNHIAGQQREVI